jgi:hypothetical protein
MSSPAQSAQPRPIAVALRWGLLALATYGAIVALFAVHYGGPEWFLHLGHNNERNLGFARRVLGRDVIVPHLDGHDGRYFWVQARDPLLLHPRTDAPLLNRPVYRSQRVAYPLLAAPWRVFGERGLLWGLVGTNLVLVGAGAFVAALLALEVGGPARAALGFIFCPAVVISGIGDLSDTMAVGALLLCLLLLLRGRRGWAYAAGAVAVLAKEPMLLGLVGVALLWPRLTRRQRLLLVGIPGAVAAAWAVYVRWRLGWPATSIEEFTAPFYGYVDAWRRGWSVAHNWTDAAGAFALIPFAVVTVVRWSRRRRSLLLDAALPFALLVPFFSAQVLDILLNSVRAVGPAVPLVWIDFYVRDVTGARRASPPPPSAPSAIADRPPTR